MTIDHAIAPSQLMAEIAEIDVLLMQYEDWRALLQLETREKKGDAIQSVNGDTLKGLLLESLSVNPLFARRQQLLAELEKVARDLQRLGPRTEPPVVTQAPGETAAPLVDDLTKISGIDARLAKRLKILNVRSFSQIANWTSDDVEYVSNTLGLDTLIRTEDWIGQAAHLVQSSGAVAPASDAWVHALNDLSPSAPQKAAPLTAAPKSIADTPKTVAEAEAPSGAQILPNIAPAVEAVPPAAIAADKPVAPAAPVLPVAAPPVVTPPPAEPVAKAVPPDSALIKPPTPKVAPADAGSVARPVAAASVPVIAAPAAVVDESWKKLVPASPLAARIYKTESPPPVVLQEPVKIAPVEMAVLQLPAMPLAATHYKGAVLELKQDGAIYGSLVPAKPLPARAFRTAVPEITAQPIQPAMAASPKPIAAQAAAAQGASVKPESKAADILQHTLPPLPLRPSAPPVKPPIPQVQSQAQSPAPSTVPPQLAAASAHAEALMLAVVAARSPNAASASPPPLPTEGMNGKSAQAVQSASAPTPPPPPPARPAHITAAVSPPAILEDVEPRSRQAAVEARVTIKRTEDALANTVLRTPGGTDVHLGSRRGAQQHDEFDGTSYAAYRGSIEEASVQIVRRPPATKTPEVPPPLTPAVASAAHAAAQNAAQLAAQAVQANLPVARDQAETDAPAATTMGRFLKALTGQ